MSNINRHKRKVPINKESVKKIKKKHSLWKRFMETKKEKTILIIVGLEIKSVN